jgi:hypothetical protein
MVVTGVPSHGKSRFALELLCSMALTHIARSPGQTPMIW